MPAQSAPYSAFEWMQRQTSGNTHRIGVEIGGVRATPQPVNLSGWQRAGNYGVNPTANGLTLGASLEIPDGNGKFRANYRGTIGKAALADGMGILVRNAARFVGPLGLAAMVADIAMNWPSDSVRPNPDVAPGDDKAFLIKDKRGELQCDIDQWTTDQQQLVYQSKKTEYAHQPRISVFKDTLVKTDHCLVVVAYSIDGVRQADHLWQQQAPKKIIWQDQWIPANWEEARPDYEAMNPLPADVLQKQVDWARKQDGKNGIEPYKINVTPTGITGPSTLPPTTTETRETFTRKGADGRNETVERTTRTTRETGVTYEGDKVKVTPKETVTTTDKITDADGGVRETTDTTTTETTTDDTPKEETPGLCDLYPDILACAKPDLDTPEDEISRENREVTYEAENLFGTGSCPANLQTNLSTLNQVVTVWDWQKTCEMALPLRALVIALASFAAFLIVMPGETRV